MHSSLKNISDVFHEKCMYIFDYTPVCDSCHWTYIFNSFMSLSYRNQTIVLLCANQWTGFYMIGTFVMKELKLSQKLLRPLENYFFTMLKSI